MALLTGTSVWSSARYERLEDRADIRAATGVEKRRDKRHRLFGKGLVASQVAFSLVLVILRACLWDICRVFGT